MNVTNEQDFDYIVSPKRRLLDLKLKELWNYRDMVRLLVKRDFTSRYKQTILGPLWAIIQPLINTVVFSIIFGKLARLTTADIAGDYQIPGFLFYMAGNICWGYFSSTVSAVSNTFISAGGLMSKIYYPRVVIPVSTALSNLIQFFIQLALLIITSVIFVAKGIADITLSWKILLVPLIVLQMILLAVAIGMLISSITTKYRDMVILVGIGLRILHYFSPVAYGLQLVANNAPQYFNLYMLNPVTPIITTFRYAVFGFGYFNIGFCLISWIVTCLLLFLGLMAFNRIEKTFVDIV